MKPKMALKISIDFVMTLLLLLLMARQITGSAAHEWLGAGMFVLWIVHHILNIKWHGHLFRGKYTTVRILQTAVNLLLLFSMIGTVVSFIILSREVFSFLPITGGIALARSMHILCTFWGLVLMSLHLGLHWNTVLGMMRKSFGSVKSKPVRISLRAAGSLVAIYGVYSLLKNQIQSYLFLTSHFVFFDYERPTALFFIEYIAIMGLFVFAGYYVSAGLHRLSGTKKAAAKHGR